MKLTRLVAYAATGIIAGLLIENKALIVKQCAEAKARMFKKKVQKNFQRRFAIVTSSNSASNFHARNIL